MKKYTVITVITGVLLLVVMVLLIFQSNGFVMKETKRQAPIAITNVQAEVDGEILDITLPYTFKDLPYNTPVVITADIVPKSGDVIYMKTAYTPTTVFAGGVEVYKFGDLDDYPSFMSDPATEVYLVDPGGTGHKMTLRMEMCSPASRNSMVVYAPLMGDTKDVVIELVNKMKETFLFSVMQIMAGAILLVISAIVIIFERKGIMFFWLGLFSLTTGLWAFGECDLTGLFIKNPTLLYLFAFLGLFTLTVPVLQFTSSIISFKNPKPIWCVTIFMTIAAIAALVLQLLGRVPLSVSMYFFHAAIPLNLCLLLGFTLYEYLRYQNLSAKRFLFPILILAISAVAEVLNYQMRFTYLFASVFQAGIMVFVIFTGVICGFFIKDSIQGREREKQLAYEVNLMEIQVQEQKKRSLLLVQDAEKIRQQRHDLHHQLTVVKELADTEPNKLKDYIGTLIANIPTSQKNYCENIAVNALISHYEPLCKALEITLTTNLVVPESLAHITDSELCVIFGNLLENAKEACQRMEEAADKFIRLNSSLQYEVLTITMDNSFNGELKEEEGRFWSSKRDDYGIGLSSVQAIARKHSGDARFEQEENTFLSSIYVRI